MKALRHIIQNLSVDTVSAGRKEVLQSLIDYIKEKKRRHQDIRLVFICTHNSRRSHLAQVWAQTMAFHFGIRNVFCYSGGTEVTAVFPKVVETIVNQGFELEKRSDTTNPVYAVKFDENEPPVLCFSKMFDDVFNPKNAFAAVMTCSSADEGCPFIAGAEKRFPIRYDDPKTFDGTELMETKYAERSVEIATEMYYVFSQVN
ncbi:low molecular weight phosphatase family protein [Flavobacterium phycosphaerae]|uniref:protein-tyrosine-phosphatase n=1 Tax=Flavobacterium phycosphaerae TaxID=2697515 RepID=UPI00138AFDBA|nr:protein-tyrosine-phosphatase [Flavobacterium phycosphaerae]